MTAPTDVGFLLRVAASQERILILTKPTAWSGGVLWEGHVEDVSVGVLTVVARKLGEKEYRRMVWRIDELAELADEGEGESQGDENDDELLVAARRMVEQARDLGGETLAERLIRERTQEA